MSDVDTELVDGLKVLDPKRPIREADMLMSLRLRQARLHEIEGVAVEYCGVSEGITQSPRL